VGVKLEISDNEEEKFKSDWFWSDGSRSKSSTPGIGESLIVMEGVVGKEFVICSRRRHKIWSRWILFTIILNFFSFTTSSTIIWTT
jgi:hypothetical protein